MAKTKYPIPLGYVYAAKEVQTIAAPLLTAAALSLAGVVAGASDDAFRWPGVTLFVLVTAALLLLVNLQLHYYARQYLYSRADIQAWVPDADGDTELRKALYAAQGDDYNIWAKFNNAAVRCFNAGTLLLGTGIAFALIPDGGKQETWRWVTAVMVLLCVGADIVWTALRYRENDRLQRKRWARLSALSDAPVVVSEEDE
ncbi:hypothetical protein [Actinomadura welshii]|uniref:hypothetical protein n=1 Tax=Actinomadura welshii TaxID=3103817 RepID=UPI0003ACFE66|nr:hypothetical protein [Actinomadura madurae]